MTRRFAYADPPYPGQAKRHYGRDFEVNHDVLIGTLCESYPDGWALSTASVDLRDLLPRCPDDVRVAAWVKPFAAWRGNVPEYTWEPVIFRSVVKRKTTGWAAFGVPRDFLVDTPPVFRGDRRGVAGAKSERFCWWVLDLLGFDAGDTLDDVFPGSGIMAKAVESYRRQRELFPMVAS